MSLLVYFLRAVEAESCIDYNFSCEDMDTLERAGLEDKWLIDGAYCIDAPEHIPAGSHKRYSITVEPAVTKR